MKDSEQEILRTCKEQTAKVLEIYILIHKNVRILRNIEIK